MKFLIISIVCFLSLSIQASPFKDLIGTYKGHNCKVVVLDLKKSNPIGYNINFPEWNYQIALFRNNKMIKSTIIGDYDDSDTVVNGSTITIFFTKEDEWTRSFFKFELDTKSKKLMLRKRNFLGSYRVKSSCSF